MEGDEEWRQDDDGDDEGVFLVGFAARIENADDEGNIMTQSSRT